jgi:hypothetical protein
LFDCSNQISRDASHINRWCFLSKKGPTLSSKAIWWQFFDEGGQLRPSAILLKSIGG